MSLIATCTHCREPFAIKRAREANKFCSQACYHADLTAKGRPHQRAETVQFQCATCHKSFSFTVGRLRAYRKSWGKDPIYCSRPCAFVGQTETETRPCAVCGTVFTTKGHSLNRTETCSDPCRRKLQRRNLIARNEKLRPSAERPMVRRLMRGYVVLRFPTINGVRGGDIYEHRHVMERHLGRALLPEETIHHLDGVRTNNELSNLELRTGRHGPGARVVDQVRFAIETLTQYPEFARDAGYELRKLTTEEAVDRLFASAVN